MEREMECGIVHCPLRIPWDPNTNHYTHPDMRRVQVLRLMWATVASAGGGRDSGAIVWNGVIEKLKRVRALLFQKDQLYQHIRVSHILSCDVVELYVSVSTLGRH